MDKEHFIDTVKFEAKKALIESSTKGQIIKGAQVLAAALLLLASSYLGTTMNQLTQTEQFKAGVIAKLATLEKNQLLLKTQQAQLIQLNEKRFQVTLAIQAEQQRRTTPVKRSDVNHEQIVLLKDQLSRLDHAVNSLTKRKRKPNTL